MGNLHASRLRIRVGSTPHAGPAVALLLTVTAAVLVGCGSTTKLPEAPATGPLTSGSVQIKQTGNAAAQVDPASVTFQIDNSGSLVVRLRVTSNAGRPQTLAVRASLFDSSGGIIGDATGGDIGLPPGAPASFELNGPAPAGTIAAATFEMTAQASPTPTAATPGSQLGTPASS